jgi:hypothetical protein
MRILALSVCACLLFGQSAMAQNYSVDLGQADTFGGFPPPDDVLAPGFPPGVVVPGLTMANVDAFSYNAPGLTPVDFGFTPDFGFSVDSLAIGSAGTALLTQAATADAQTDVFRSMGPGTNALLHDGDGSTVGILAPLGLLEGPGASIGGVDGYDYQATGPPLVGGIYWSVDVPSLAFPAYLGASAADVFTGPFAPGYVGGPIVYAPAVALGLSPGDELDALQIYDRGVVGVFDALDIVLFSLAPGSPSLALLGVTPGDILMSDFVGFMGPFTTVSELGMAPGDNMNALTVKSDGMLPVTLQSFSID